VKAVGLYDYGGPEVLRVLEIPTPHAGPGDVRIRVRAAGVNPTDTLLRSGWRRGRWGAEPPFVPGMDVAGTIDEVGDGVEDSHGWSVGDEVTAIVVPKGNSGGYSEHVVVPADSVTRKPKGTTWAEAASFLMNALTARQALDLLNLPAGATLGVTGGAGAFGGYVIQLAANAGLRVIADSSPADEELIRSFGAHEIVPRGDGVAARFRAVVPGGLDAIADGALLHEQVIPAIRDGGQIAVLRLWEGEAERGITVNPFTVRSYATNAAAINRVREQVESGVLAIRLAATLPYYEAAEAHRRLERGGLRGRVVLEF
jgi:NADPH:quinone reductase-like Zn-dependent oxidoreductase